MVRVRVGNTGITAAVLLAVFSLEASFAQGIRGTVRGHEAAAPPLEMVKVDLFVDGRLVRTTFTDARGE